MKNSSTGLRSLKAFLFTGLLAVPLLTTTGRAVTYIDETWTPTDLLSDSSGNLYAMWDDAANWSGGVVPVLSDPGTGNPYKVHFNETPDTIVPCVIDGINVSLGGIVLGDYGGGGTLIVTNGATLTAGFAEPGGLWTGVAFPSGTSTLYIGSNCTVTLGSHLWVGQGNGTEGTIIVDGGTLSVPNGQLGVGWNGTGGTNYMVVTNNGTVYLRNWATQTLGEPGNASVGILDISTGGRVIVTNNASSFFPVLVSSNQLTAYAGLGTVSWNYDPVGNATTIIGVPPVTASTPIISGQPTNTVVAAGGTATFNVSIVNVSCNYQWLLNNQPLTDGNGISGSHSPTLTISGVGSGNVGIYSVLATNTTSASSSVQSTGASLTTESISLYPVVTINGIPGDTYEVDYTTSMTPPVVWTALTTVTLGSFTQYVVDTATPMSVQRFYRVIQH